MRKFVFLALGHCLYLKGEHAVGIEHRRDTVGQHTEVLGTQQHTAVAKHILQAAHGYVAPIHGVTLIEIAVVDAHISLTLIVAEHLTDRRMQRADAGMIHICIIRVFYKQHIRYKAVESVTNPDAVLVAHAGKRLLNPALCAVFWQKGIQSVGFLFKNVFPHIFRVHSKQPFYHSVIDKRLGHKILAPRQPHALNLLGSHGQRR